MKQKYSLVLGNLGNTKDRFCGAYKEPINTVEMLKQAAAIPKNKGVELIETWDITPDNVKQMRRLLDDLGLACVSVIPDLFTDKLYKQGGLSAANSAVRNKALSSLRGACESALALNCSIVNLWPGQDGYDYLLTTDYIGYRERLTEAVVKIADEFPSLKISLEYKPKEPRNRSLLATMADTLLVIQKIGRNNVGVTIDTGHAFLANESLGESIGLAKQFGNKLLHMHFNDNHGSWDDDMIVGSVHTICYIEALWWLRRCEYTGWLSMDQYPYRIEAAAAIGESVLWLERLGALVDTHYEKLAAIISEDSPIAVSRFLRENL